MDKLAAEESKVAEGEGGGSWDVDEEAPPPLSPNLSARHSFRDLHFHLTPAPLWLRLCARSSYVAATTLVAMVLPFFSQITGLVSAGGLVGMRAVSCLL